MNLRLIFMGTPRFSLPALEALHQSPHRIEAVVTQPDRPVGRGRVLRPTPVKVAALERGMEVLQPSTVKEEWFIARLKAISPDAIVVVAFGQILPKEVLDIPRLGCINLHPSLLPKYRGAAPIQWAILNGEKRTGITVILMDEGMDTGPILMAREVGIGPEETADELQERLAPLGAQLLLNVLDGLTDGSLQPLPQDPKLASYAPPLRKEEAWIEWSEEASQVHNRIRGLRPWPVAYTEWRGKRLKIFRGRPIQGPTVGRPGEILKVDREGIVVQTGNGYLLVTEVQPANSRRMEASAFVLGHPITPGDVLGTSRESPNRTSLTM